MSTDLLLEWVQVALQCYNRKESPGEVDSEDKPTVHLDSAPAAEMGHARQSQWPPDFPESGSPATWK